MRGKARKRVFFWKSLRITPAYAGKSLTVSQKLEITHGSPPPMRGKVYAYANHLLSRGITPAYAGKRVQAAERAACCWDHPRLCGEKLRSITIANLKPGSPPPMRGKVLFTRHFRTAYRITPAYAGKRRGRTRSTSGRWDHPRLCGEKCGNSPLRTTRKGSPPPMRGKEVTTYLISRLIKDHPRLCGEKIFFFFWV